VPTEPLLDSMSETEYLAREVAEAKTALKRSVADLKSNAKSSLDLSAWARAYPWPAIGAAAATGFALAAMFASRGKAPNLPTNEVSDAAGSPATTATEGQAKPEPRRSMFASLSPAIFDLAKLIIETVVMSAIRSAQAPPKPEERSHADSQTQ
jgi:hypothetical protein